MENFWNELVDQVAFVDYCLWEDVYSSKKIKYKLLAQSFGEECIFVGWIS